MMMRPGCSAAAMALRILATASGSTVPSALTRMPRSAPMASAVRIVSPACAGPTETAMISVALPASLRRSASSTAISSKGFIDILTLPSSTPVPSALTRIFTSLSTARLTGTRIFMAWFGFFRLLSRLLSAAPWHPRDAAARERTGRRARGQRIGLVKGSVLVSPAGALQRVELADFSLRATLARALEDRLRHPSLDQSRADRVDPHPGAEERIRRRLRQTHDAGLAGAIEPAA